MKFAAIFDWDGVIVDSSRAHELSWDQLAEEEQRPLPEGHFKKGFGKTNKVIIPTILQWTDDAEEVERLSLRKEELYRRILSSSGLEALPGVRELLASLQANNIPMAIGTSTSRLNIDTALRMLNLEEYFSSIVTAEDVKKGKPDPEVFLKGAARLGYAPQHCVVFEDAHYGIEAAKAGNMKAIAVATTHPFDSFTNTDLVVDRLTEITIDKLKILFN